MAEASPVSEQESAHFERDMRPAPVPIWLEGLVGLEWLTLRAAPVYWGWGVPRGAGAPVIVVPGFLGSDIYLYELYWWLRRIGYRAHYSRIGRNAECLDVVRGRLIDTIDRVHAEAGRPVHLIGHSLGGMLARSAAAHHPARVASVVTLGSPFRGIRSHPLVLHASDRVRLRIQLRRGAEAPPGCFTGHCECAAVSGLRQGMPASVPDLAVYSRTDGIVDWRYCINDDPQANVEVSGTHIGLVFNPQVYRLLAQRLSRLEATAAPA
jgi:pimeloyl-ACP methyl ester carboxylesterase